MAASTTMTATLCEGGSRRPKKNHNTRQGDDRSLAKIVLVINPKYRDRADGGTR